jgi:hypothetical protein
MDPRSLAAAIPDVLTPYSKIPSGGTLRDGLGVLYRLPGGVAAGAGFTFTHGLGRVPNRCEIMDNGAAFKGDSYFSAAGVNTCTIVNELALNAGAVVRVV